MIAAVKRGKGYQFADLTAGNYAFGQLPRSEQGNLAVLVKENDGEQIMLPEAPMSDAVIDANIVGALGEDGIFTGKYEEVRHGYLESTMRAAFQTPRFDAKADVRPCDRSLLRQAGDGQSRWVRWKRSQRGWRLLRK